MNYYLIKDMLLFTTLKIYYLQRRVYMSYIITGIWSIM